MAVTAKFLADFASFHAAVDKAEVELKSMETGASKVGASLSRMVDSLSGRKLVQDATLAAEAVDRIGGVTKLTASELTRLSAQAQTAADKLRAMGQDVPERLQRMATAASDLAPKLSLSQKAASLLTSTFGQFTLAGLASQAIDGLVSELKVFIATGSKLPAVEASFSRLSSALKVDSHAMLANLTTATKGMVSNYDLMLSANKAMLLGLPVTAQAMGELAKTATVLGKAMGQDATKSLEDLITALGRSSPLILDNLGLTVKVGEANEAYAAKLGKTVEQMTEAEKKMAFYEAAMEAARKKTQELGEQTQTLGEIAASVWTQVGNVISSTSAAINVGLGSALSSGRGFIDFLSDTMHFGSGAAIQAAALREQIKQLDAQRRASMGKDVDLTPALEKQATSTKKVADETTKHSKALKDVAVAAPEVSHALSLLEKAHQHQAAALKFEESQWKATTKATEAYLRALPTAKMQEFIPTINAVSGAIDGLGQSLTLTIPKMSMLEKVFGSAKDFGSALGSTIMSAIQGGGSPINAAAGFVGQSITTHIAKELTTKGGIAFSGAIGGMINSVLPGLGSLLGPLVGKISSAIAGLFNRDRGRDLVEDFAAGFGGFDALHVQLNTLGAEGERLWIKLTQGVGRNNPDEAKKAIDAITSALAKKQDASEDAVIATEAEAQATIETAAAASAALDELGGRLATNREEWSGWSEDVTGYLQALADTIRSMPIPGPLPTYQPPSGGSSSFSGGRGGSTTVQFVTPNMQVLAEGVIPQMPRAMSRLGVA